ncbi:hypothetical protein HDU85_004104 [Gaertneriomyces sp. JEL0708]|nr:hypothetical protein HDU85_004104 [Gaertneriomyces sp. JEL0708]
MTTAGTEPPPDSPSPASTHPLPDAATLRLRLETLGYTEPLLPESIPLVRHLFADLLLTTESAKKFKAQHDDLLSENASLKGQVGPLRNTVAQLTRENAELHMELVKAKEEGDDRIKKVKGVVRQMEIREKDLRFLVGQYAKRVELEEKKAEEARNKCEGLFAKIGMFENEQEKLGKRQQKAVDKAKLFERLQKIDVETGLEALETNGSKFVSPDPVVADMVRLAQGRVDELEKDCTLLRTRNEDLEHQLEMMQNNLAHRHQEITRLTTELSLARSSVLYPPVTSNSDTPAQHTSPTSSAYAIPDLPTAHQRIQHLESQLQLLNQHCESLEGEISFFHRERKEVWKAVEEERKVGQREVEGERELRRGLERGLKDVSQRVREIERSRSRSPRKGFGRVDRATSPTKAGSEDDDGGEAAFLRQQVEHLNELLERAGKRVKDLSHECEGLRAWKAKWALREERPVPAHQRKTQMQRTKERDEKVSADNAENEAAADAEDERQLLRERVMELEAAVSHHSEKERDFNQQLGEAAQVVDQLAQQVQALAVEADTLRVQLSASRSEIERLTLHLGGTSKERDDLVEVLKGFEEQLLRVQKSVADVTEERDAVLELYEQAAKQLHSGKSANSDINSTAPPELIAARSRVSDLETELDALRADLQSLLSRQHASSENDREAWKVLQSECDRLREVITQKDTERDALLADIQRREQESQQLHVTVQTLQNQLEMERNRVSDIQQASSNDAQQVQQLKATLDNVTAELERAHTEYDKLFSVKASLEQQLSEKKELVMELDRERDRDRDVIDHKTERIVALESHITELENDIVGTRRERDELGLRIDVLENLLNEREKECDHLIRRLENTAQDRDALNHDANRLSEENRALTSDLSALTRENQLVSAQLSTVTGENRSLKTEIAELERQVQKLDDIVLSKEGELERVMSMYRKVVAELERMNQGLMVGDEDRKRTQVELTVKERKMAEVLHRLSEVEEECSRLRIDVRAWEGKCSSLTRALHTSDKEKGFLESELKRMDRELTRVMEVLSGVERSRDEMRRTVDLLRVEGVRFEAEMKKYEEEIQELNGVLHRERDRNRVLEGLVRKERDRAARGLLSSPGADAGDAIAKEGLERLVRELEEELAKWRGECERLRERANSLQEELRLGQRKMSALEQQVRDLTSLLASYDQTHHDAHRSHLTHESSLSSIPDTPNKTDLERRILKELGRTKHQLKKYEAQIARRISIGELSETSETEQSDETSSRISELHRENAAVEGVEPRTPQRRSVKGDRTGSASNSGDSVRSPKDAPATVDDERNTRVEPNQQEEVTKSGEKLNGNDDAFTSESENEDGVATPSTIRSGMTIRGRATAAGSSEPRGNAGELESDGRAGRRRRVEESRKLLETIVQVKDVLANTR